METILNNNRFDTFNEGERNPMITLICLTILGCFCCIGAANSRTPNAGTMFADMLSAVYLVPLLIATMVFTIIIRVIEAPFKLMKKIVNKGE